MRTYMPFASYAECANCFSTKRLNKQRHEALEVLYMLCDMANPVSGRNGFFNSPPKKVWEHNRGALIRYGLALCDEWEKRQGRPDPCRERFIRFRDRMFRRGETDRAYTREPEWITSDTMHLSHRAILARQEPEHYGQFGFKRDPEDEKVFYWPIEEAERDRFRTDLADDDAENDDESSDEDLSDDVTCNCEMCRRER